MGAARSPLSGKRLQEGEPAVPKLYQSTNKAEDDRRVSTKRAATKWRGKRRTNRRRSHLTTAAEHLGREAERPRAIDGNERGVGDKW